VSRRPPADAGATLVELLVAIAIMAVIGGGVVSVAVASFRTERLVVEVRDAMDTARLSVEDLRRDVRAARRVLTGSDATTLVLWRDVDGDAVTDPGETITYRLIPDAAGAPCPGAPATGAARLTRQVDSGPTVLLGCDYRSGTAFAYTGVPVDRVRVTLTARARLDSRGASAFAIDEVVRVRNVQ
jgi:type II secretory pathway pseudopilin PulG